MTERSQQQPDSGEGAQSTPGGGHQARRPEQPVAPPVKQSTGPNETAVANQQTHIEQPSPYDLRDLVAQEVMADAAVLMTVAAFLTFIVTSFGTILIWRQVKLTREAVEDTGRATAAMIRQNEIAETAQKETQASAEAQIRAYIFVAEVHIAPITEGDTVFDHARITLQNGGQSPALIDRVTVKGALGRETKGKWHSVKLLKQDIAISFSLAPNAKPLMLPTATFDENVFHHTSGSKEWRIFIEGAVHYRDVFKRKRKTIFSYCTDSDFWNEYEDDEAYACKPLSDRNQIG